MLKRAVQRKRVGTSALMRLSRLRALKDDLDMNDDQVRKLWDVETDVVRNIARFTMDIRLTRFEALKAITSKPVDFNQIRMNAKKVMDLRLQRKMAIIDAFEQGLNVLSQEQKDQLPDVLSVWEDEVEEEMMEHSE
jgi:hypothetical protein